MWDLHHRLVLLCKCRFNFGYCFFRRLLLVVRDDALNSFFVPSRRKSVLGHTCTRPWVLCLSASEQQGDNIPDLLTKARELIFGQQTASLHGSDMSECG
jgi:hypothetical protein